VVKYGKVVAISFNIFLDPKYHQVKVVGDETLSYHYQLDLGMLFKNLKCDLLKGNNEC
jgi:hypothetical protein